VVAGLKTLGLSKDVLDGILGNNFSRLAGIQGETP